MYVATTDCTCRSPRFLLLESRFVEPATVFPLFSMAVPWNIRGSASQLFFQDKESPQCKALLAISALPHPDRSILGAFINDAVDPQEAVQYFLRVTSLNGSGGVPPEDTILHFLSKWKTLIDKC